MDTFIDQAVAALSAALISALIALVVQLLKKYNIDISLARQAQIEAFADQAILGIEEKAATFLKAHARKMSAAEKLDGAVTTLVDLVPGVSKNEAANLIHARLPVIRGAVADFTTAVLKQATNRDGQ